MQSETRSQNSNYDIRFAHETEGKALGEFLNSHWRENHIFSSCQKLLDWQHLNREHRRYNFVVGISRQSNNIHGVLGFIPIGQFDPDIDIGMHCWLAIWKVREDARGHKLGRRLLSYLINVIKPQVLSTVSASEMTLPMYRAMGFQTGRLRHYFICHPDKHEFNLIMINQSNKPYSRLVSANPKISLKSVLEDEIRLNLSSCFFAPEDLPHKTPNYLINRYLKHPLYQYHIYAIQDATTPIGIVVIRVCIYGNDKAIRIVDFIGPSASLRGLSDHWISLLRLYNAEYNDFYNVGICEQDLLASGFTQREDVDEVVIPNYFEPFSRTNVEIEYMIDVPAGTKYRIVKGDSDQDRPNYPKNKY